MERLDLIVADWPEIDGWRIAPASCSFAAEGARLRIGRHTRIGDGARIGANAKDVIDLGHANGYRKCLMQVDGVAWIGAGCRWFTLAQAVRHWSDHDEDRADTCDLMAAAVAMATRRGWKLDT